MRKAFTLLGLALVLVALVAIASAASPPTSSLGTTINAIDTGPPLNVTAVAGLNINTNATATARGAPDKVMGGVAATSLANIDDTINTDTAPASRGAPSQGEAVNMGARIGNPFPPQLAGQFF